MPASSFDDFVAQRPDEERWELIEGNFVMQAQPTIDHQIIARNIERLLNDALESSGAERFALQNPSVDLAPVIVGNKYVPDVAVLDIADVAPGRHTVTRCYLAAEIVSPSDRRRVARRGRPKIDVKVVGYASLPDCEAILIVEQNRYAVDVGQRVGETWSWATLAAATDELVLPGFGLRCRLSEVYAKTSLARAGMKRPAEQG